MTPIRLRRRYVRRRARFYVFTAKCLVCGQHSAIFRTVQRWPTGDYRRFVHQLCQPQGGEL